MLKIYLAHPITGLTFDQVVDYYMNTAEELYDYDVFYPMIGKGYLRTETDLKPSGYVFPPSTDNAIVGRDHWMVHQSDVLFADLMGASRVSIGAVMEIAWAKAYNKHVIVAMEEANPHRHAFVLSSAHIIYPTHEEAVEYLKILGRRSI